MLAAGLQAHADQIGAYYAQVSAIESDPLWNGGDYHRADRDHGPFAGMAIARRLAQLTYRGAEEIQAALRQPSAAWGGPATAGDVSRSSPTWTTMPGRWSSRFDPATYVVATRAMNTHDVGRGRGGARAALASATMPVTVAGISSDRLVSAAPAA